MTKLKVCVIKYQCFCRLPNHLPPAAMTSVSLGDTITFSISFPSLCSSKIILASGLCTCHFYCREWSMSSSLGWFFNIFKFSWNIISSDRLCLHKVPPNPIFGGSFLSQHTVFSRDLSHSKIIYSLCVCVCGGQFVPPWESKLHKNREHICLLCPRHYPNSNSVKLKLLRKRCRRLKDVPRVIQLVSGRDRIQTQAERIETILPALLNSKNEIKPST